MRRKSHRLRTTLLVIGAFAAGWFSREANVELSTAFHKGGETLRSQIDKLFSDKGETSYLKRKANRRRLAANNGNPIPYSDWFKSTVIGSNPDDRSYYIVAVPEFVVEDKNQAQVVVFCENDTIRLYIAMVNDFGPSPLVVSWSVDEEIKQAAAWHPSGDRRMIGLWFTDQALPFIESMIGGSVLVARVQDRTGMQQSKVFQIKGIEEAIPHISAHCAWSTE